tara:strand:+ start:1463 stop:1861 length:399 start_codon:yes stop_codon:yes gene_type:complete
MAFKLGSDGRNKIRTPSNTTFFKNKSKTPIFRKQLESGTLAEANMDGSIHIDSSVKPGSKRFHKIIKHEMSHKDDMETGRAAYGDEWVMWEDKIYFRKEVDGVKVIDGPNGRWPEGDENHPWEMKAIQAEKE